MTLIFGRSVVGKLPGMGPMTVMGPFLVNPPTTFLEDMVPAGKLPGMGSKLPGMGPMTFIFGRPVVGKLPGMEVLEP